MAPIISASILSADFTNLADQIRQVENAGAEWLHIDVMDGHFVPPITMGPLIVSACKRITRLPLDVHLMITQPERHFEAFAKAGAASITFQQEATHHAHRAVEAIHHLGCKAGVAINPATSENVLSYLLQQIDLVLVMTVNPGYAAQAFIPGMEAKIARVRQLLDAIPSTAWLQVDGGINPDTISAARLAGAANFVAGSAVFNHPQGISAGISSLRKKLGD
jgi:ribulose-phosphate 3-epimerase